MGSAPATLSSCRPTPSPRRARSFVTWAPRRCWSTSTRTRYCIDVDALCGRIKQAVDAGEGRPAAVMPVHFAGAAARLDEVWDLARELDLAVVEDAAHAFPSAFAGRQIGWMPDDVRGTVCFSFYATKTITTGEGGMVTCGDPAIADRIRLMSLHGLSRQAWSRYAGGGWRYDIEAPGYKYNLTDMAAAMGLVQLTRADEMTKRRVEIADRYTQAWADSRRVGHADRARLRRARPGTSTSSASQPRGGRSSATR